MGKRKIIETNVNSDICEILIDLGEYERNTNKNMIKYKAYRKAASVIANYPKKIESGKEAMKLEGVGAKIAKKIDEILKTGKLQKLEEIKSDEGSTLINQLVKVSGIGPSHAHTLMKKHGIKSIDDLRNNQHLLNHQQQIGLKHYEDFQLRIPREEMVLLEKTAFGLIHSVDPLLQATICGSYRRGGQDFGDIDILLTHPTYVSTSKHKPNLITEIVKSMEQAHFITDTLSQGDVKFMGVCCLSTLSTSQACKIKKTYPYRRLDMRLFPHDQYYCALLFFSAGDLLNRELRIAAKNKGFVLNEYTIRPVGSTGIPGEPLPVSSEKDIFDYLDIPYIEPEDRRN